MIRGKQCGTTLGARIKDMSSGAVTDLEAVRNINNVNNKYYTEDLHPKQCP